MAQRRYSTRLEGDEAVVVATLDFWDNLSAHLREVAFSDRALYEEATETANHIDEWVERTRYKKKDER